jgi:hypothetical protein
MRILGRSLALLHVCRFRADRAGGTGDHPRKSGVIRAVGGLMARPGLEWQQVAGNAESMDELLRDELLRRAERDQQARRPAEPDPEAMAQVDAENLPWLKETIAHNGWPTRSMVGEDASHSAWLLVQHADRDPAFQRHCLDLLAVAAADGEADQQCVAYLTDRVNLAEGRPQEYGTQVIARDGQWMPRRLRDSDGVDDRRAAVGLEPMADYLTRFGDPRPASLPCQSCGTPIEFWLPDAGERTDVVCPDCGWSTPVSLEPW